MTEENQSTDNNQTTETNELNIYEVSDIHNVRALYCSMQAKAKEFEIKLIDAEAQRDDYKAKVNDRNHKHLSDVNTIGLALIEVAEDKEWCSEYDEFIEELNGNLSVELPTRKRNFDVTIKVSREVYTYLTVQVEATSEEDAQELVEEDTYTYLDELPRDIGDWEERDEDIDVTRVERS
jgi:hypothetical protein